MLSPSHRTPRIAWWILAVLGLIFALFAGDRAVLGILKTTLGTEVGLTATLDILRDIAAGGGPKRSLLALGYAGWGAGQLDSEIQANAWLCVPADEELIFDDQLTDKWERCISKLGVDFTLLSGDAGHA